MIPLLKVTGRLLSVSESTRKLNPELYAQIGLATAQECQSVQDELGHGSSAGKLKAAPKRLRQSSKPLLNKLETDWHKQLLADPYIERIYLQSVKLKLCNGVTYTPDFMAVQIRGHIICYECKGFMRDDAAIKIKLAAKEYPMFSWFLVWKEGGQWQKQKILA